MSECHNKPILILMGPTASGKSAMGISIAKHIGGVILNADAMQSYADLQILSARPTQDEMQGIDHRLYGMWDARIMGNAALWQQAAITQINAVHAEGKTPILLGGTGMYIKALTEGLSTVPPISNAVREKVAQLSSRPATLHQSPDTGVAAQAGMTDLYQALQQHDPAMAAKLEPSDRQRVSRALEVMLETGRSLADWQAEQTPAPFSKSQCHFAYVDIARETLYERINLRFERMIEQGALEEVQALTQQFTPQERAEKRYPILKTIGLPELMAYQAGELSQAEAIAKAQQLTRNYAKRQMTWIRGQVDNAQPLPFEGYEDVLGEWLNSL